MSMEAWKIRKNQVFWLCEMHEMLGKGWSNGYHYTTLLNPPNFYRVTVTEMTLRFNVIICIALSILWDLDFVNFHFDYC